MSGNRPRQPDPAKEEKLLDDAMPKKALSGSQAEALAFLQARHKMIELMARDSGAANSLNHINSILDQLTAIIEKFKNNEAMDEYVLEPLFVEAENTPASVKDILKEIRMCLRPFLQSLLAPSNSRHLTNIVGALQEHIISFLGMEQFVSTHVSKTLQKATEQASYMAAMRGKRILQEWKDEVASTKVGIDQQKPYLNLGYSRDDHLLREEREKKKRLDLSRLEEEKNVINVLDNPRGWLALGLNALNKNKLKNLMTQFWDNKWEKPFAYWGVSLHSVLSANIKVMLSNRGFLALKMQKLNHTILQMNPGVMSEYDIVFLATKKLNPDTLPHILEQNQYKPILIQHDENQYSLYAFHESEWTLRKTFWYEVKLSQKLPETPGEIEGIKAHQILVGIEAEEKGGVTWMVRVSPTEVITGRLTSESSKTTDAKEDVERVPDKLINEVREKQRISDESRSAIISAVAKRDGIEPLAFSFKREQKQEEKDYFVINVENLESGIIKVINQNHDDSKLLHILFNDNFNQALERGDISRLFEFPGHYEFPDFLMMVLSPEVFKYVKSNEITFAQLMSIFDHCSDEMKGYGIQFLKLAFSRNGQEAMKEKFISFDEMISCSKIRAFTRVHTTSSMRTDIPTDANGVSYYNCFDIRFLKLLISDNGLTAFREKLMTWNQINNFSLGKLENLLSMNGLKALRSGILNLKEIQSMNEVVLYLILTDDVFDAIEKGVISRSDAQNASSIALNFIFSKVGETVIKDGWLTIHNIIYDVDPQFLPTLYKLSDEAMLAFKNKLIPIEKLFKPKPGSQAQWTPALLSSLVSDIGLDLIKRGQIDLTCPIDAVCLEIASSDLGRIAVNEAILPREFKQPEIFHLNTKLTNIVNKVTETSGEVKRETSAHFNYLSMPESLERQRWEVKLDIVASLGDALIKCAPQYDSKITEQELLSQVSFAFKKLDTLNYLQIKYFNLKESPAPHEIAKRKMEILNEALNYFLRGDYKKICRESWSALANNPLFLKKVQQIYLDLVDEYLGDKQLTSQMLGTLKSTLVAQSFVLNLEAPPKADYSKKELPPLNEVGVPKKSKSWLSIFSSATPVDVALEKVKEFEAQVTKRGVLGNG